MHVAGGRDWGADMNKSSEVTLGRRMLCWGSVICLAAWLVGCGGGSEEPPAAPGVATIGAAGGTVLSEDGAQVVFPKDSLRGEVTVRIAKDSTGAPPLPPSAVPAGAVYAITPHGGAFDELVEVSIPVERADIPGDGQLLLVTAEPGDTQWRVLSGASYYDGKMRAPVMHFSFFQTIRLVNQIMPTLVTKIDGANNVGGAGIARISALAKLPSSNVNSIAAELSFPTLNTQSVTTVGGVPAPVTSTTQCRPMDYSHGAMAFLFRGEGGQVFTPDIKHPAVVPRDPWPRFPGDGGALSYSTRTTIGGAFPGFGAVHYYGNESPRIFGLLDANPPTQAMRDRAEAEQNNGPGRYVLPYGNAYALPPAGDNAADNLYTWQGTVNWLPAQNGSVRIDAFIMTTCGLFLEAVPLAFKLDAPPPTGYEIFQLLAIGPDLYGYSSLPPIEVAEGADAIIRFGLYEDGHGWLSSAFVSGVTYRFDYSPDPATVDWQPVPASAVTRDNFTVVNDQLSGGYLVRADGVQAHLTAVQTSQSGYYRVFWCMPIKGCADTPARRLVVVRAPPTISAQPAGQTVQVGQTASFTVATAGAPAPTLQWQKRSFVAAAFGFLAWTNIDGATSATYTTPPLALADSATQYRVFASNALGGVASDIAMLTVVERFTPPVIDAQPGNLNVTVGGTAVFAATVSGPGPLSYQWRRNGVNITGANSAILTLANVTALNDGRYDLVVTNSAGSTTTEPGLLQVTLGTPIPLAPAIAASPASITVAAGNAASFAVAVTGTGPYSYQWFKSGVTAPLAEGDFPSFSIAAVTPADAGAYSVRVTNNVGNVLSAAATLTVGPGSGAPLAPTITTPPVALAVLPGGGATFAVAVTGTGPFTYQWRRNGADIAGATAAVLHIAAVGALDGGQYAVEVRNAAGSVSTDSVPLIVIGAPLITQQPAAAAAAEGRTATLSVAASGDGLLYLWTRNQIAIPGATAASYTTPALTLADHGAVYGVIVYNGAGLIFSETAVLSVVAAPVSIGGSVSGLAGAGLVLQNNAGDNLAVAANGPFTFATAIAPGASYSVTILSQPSGQNCVVQGGSGTANAAVTSVVLTCNSAGALALVANSGANTLSVMRVDADTGALTAAGAPVATGQYPFAVAITPGGQYAYVTNLVGGSISSYGIDSITGVLTPIPLSTPGTQNPYGIAMDPLGRFVWVVNYGFSTASAFATHPSTGLLTAVGSPVSTGSFPYALAAHPNGNFVYVANEGGNSVSVFSVDASTGALTLVAGTIANSVLRPHGIAVDPSGRFVYVAGAGGQEVAAYRINSSTGALTVVGYIRTGGAAESVAVHPNGQFVYAVTRSSDALAVFSINPITGALTSAGTPVATGSNPGRLAVNTAGSRVYVTNGASNTVSAFSIGSGGATLTSLGAAAAVGSVPEGLALTP